MKDSAVIEKIKQSMYYIIIGVISFIALVFLPMIGTEVGLAWNIPNTVVGWIVWIATKLIVALINVLIFHSFMQQGKLNAKEHTNYKEAIEILGKVKVKKYIPRSPKKWQGQQYGRKGVTIFISTSLATVALTQAILSFEWATMLSYLFTIIMGLIFGVMQMKNAEEYWTEEFLKYAKLVQDEAAQEEADKNLPGSIQEITDIQIAQAAAIGPEALEELKEKLKEEEVNNDSN